MAATPARSVRTRSLRRRSPSRCRPRPPRRPVGCRSPPSRRPILASGLAPGYIPWTSAASNLALLDNDPRVAALRRGCPGLRLRQLRPGLLRHQRHRRQLQRLPGLRHQQPDQPDAAHVLRLPGRSGRPVGLRQPALHLRRGDPWPDRLRHARSPGAVNLERFRGVRIFDISDIDNPVQLPGVQLCRGSHTHTLVTDPDDPDNVYVYNSGTAGVRSPLELAGCENAALTQDPVTTGNPTQWRIDVIKVPLAAPETAAVVSQPRIFTDAATGAFNGLQNTLPGALHPSGTAVLAPAEHQHLPRRDGVPGDRAARRRLPGQRHPARHLRPGEPGPPRCRLRPELRVLALGDVQQRRHQGDVHRRVGRRDAAPAAASPTSREWGADALFDIVDGKMQFAQLLQDAGGADDQRELRRAQLLDHPGARTATSSSRPGTKAASRSSTSPTRPTRSRSRSSTAGRSTRRRTPPGSTSAACGRRTGTTATSTAPRSRGASTPSGWSRAT